MHRRGLVGGLQHISTILAIGNNETDRACAMNRTANPKISATHLRAQKTLNQLVTRRQVDQQFHRLQPDVIDRGSRRSTECQLNDDVDVVGIQGVIR